VTFDAKTRLNQTVWLRTHDAILRLKCRIYCATVQVSWVVYGNNSKPTFKFKRSSFFNVEGFKMNPEPTFLFPEAQHEAIISQSIKSHSN